MNPPIELNEVVLSQTLWCCRRRQSLRRERSGRLRSVKLLKRLRSVLHHERVTVWASGSPFADLSSSASMAVIGRCRMMARSKHSHFLIGQIGDVRPHGNDEFVFVVGSQRDFFKRPSTHDLALQDISRLRQFLKEARVLGIPVNADQTGRVIVVIDHHIAHIYQDLAGSLPGGEVSVRPYDPFGFQHHLIHRKEAHYKGDRVPEEDSYYQDIAMDIVRAAAVILIGQGTGKSSAVGFLTEYLKTYHPDEFWRIVATETADLSALTVPQIEEIAKRQANLSRPLDTKASM